MVVRRGLDNYQNWCLILAVIISSSKADFELTEKLQGAAQSLTCQ